MFKVMHCLLIENLSFYTISQEIIVLTILYRDSIVIVLINYIASIPNYMVVENMCPSHIFCIVA